MYKRQAYMHEGRTGASTINIVFQRELGREATQEEIESIYQEKSVLFNSDVYKRQAMGCIP